MYEIKTFEQACEYIGETIGDDFKKVYALADAIIQNPADYTGPQAAMAAIRLATHRFKIGVMAQHWKIRATETKKIQDRLVKDACMVTYDGLEEVINCLKITARHDHELTKGA